MIPSSSSAAGGRGDSATTVTVAVPAVDGVTVLVHDPATGGAAPCPVAPGVVSAAARAAGGGAGGGGEPGAARPHAAQLARAPDPPAGLIPTFLKKTYDMLEDESLSNLIRWGGDGTSVVIVNNAEFSDKVLPRFFKHRNYGSFVRQLNIYGFRKLMSGDGVAEFKHPTFRRGNLAGLISMKRRVAKRKRGKADADERHKVDQVLKDMAALKARQQVVESHIEELNVTNHQLRTDNGMLWRELHLSRQRQKQMQEKMRKLLMVLLNVFHNRSHQRQLPTAGMQQLLTEAADVPRDGPIITLEEPDDASAPAPSGMVAGMSAASGSGPIVTDDSGARLPTSSSGGFAPSGAQQAGRSAVAAAAAHAHASTPRSAAGAGPGGGGGLGASGPTGGTHAEAGSAPGAVSGGAGAGAGAGAGSGGGGGGSAAQVAPPLHGPPPLSHPFYTAPGELSPNQLHSTIQYLGLHQGGEAQGPGQPPAQKRRRTGAPGAAAVVSQALPVSGTSFMASSSSATTTPVVSYPPPAPQKPTPTVSGPPPDYVQSLQTALADDENAMLEKLGLFEDKIDAEGGLSMEHLDLLYPSHDDLMGHGATHGATGGSGAGGAGGAGVGPHPPNPW